MTQLSTMRGENGMSTYVMSDLHGCYNAYKEMLEKIEFKDSDTLYILGDILDRGPNPIKIMLDVMKRPNVKVLVGNHCIMACECISFLLQEVTKENIDKIKKNPMLFEKLDNWLYNGAKSTINEFCKCDVEIRKEIMDFIMDFDVYEEIEVNGKKFILVHAGLGNFHPDKELEEYELDELVWERPDYEKKYFDDKYVISGHTPTVFIKNHKRPGYIYQGNNHIAMDCGCCFQGGRLGCLRLDDMKEFYVEKN